MITSSVQCYLNLKLFRKRNQVFKNIATWMNLKLSLVKESRLKLLNNSIYKHCDKSEHRKKKNSKT